MEKRTLTDDVHPSLMALGSFVLDLEHGELRSGDGGLAGLRKQSLEVLLILGENAGHVVSKDQLLSRVWPRVVVGEDSLTQVIVEIRRVLGDREHRLVQTVARRGYLLAADLVRPLRLVPAPAADMTKAVAIPAKPQDAVGSAPSLPARGGHRRPVVAAAGIAVLLLAVIAAAPMVMKRAASPPPLQGSEESRPLSSWPDRTPTRSLVILPFVAEGGEADQGWFADALTGDLTSSIGSWKGLFVIGRGTAARFKNPSIDPREVARELAVRYVLRGTVRRDGNRVRLNVTLVDGETGQQHWGEHYDVERDQLAGSLDDIHGNIARTLVVELGTSIGRRVERLRPDQVEADDMAMRGFAVLLRSLGQSNLMEAGRYFEDAVARDSDSIRALAGVSLVNSMGLIFQWLPDREGAIRKSEQAMARLESLDANAEFTLIARASLLNMHSDWEGLLSVSGSLIANFPNGPTSHHHRCSALLRLGRFDESILSCQRAIQISPRDSRVAIWRGLIGMNYFIQAKYADAAAHAREPVTGIPKLPFYWLLLAASLVHDGRESEARRLLEDFAERFPGFDPAALREMWPAANAAFVAGRERIILAVDQLARR